MTTTVVNVKVKHIRPEYNNLKEWIKNPNNVYIGRRGVVFIDKERFPKTSSEWANPFKVKKEGRDKCLELYESWLREKIKNKVLGCWCYPEKCHGDILIKLLNEDE